MSPVFAATGLRRVAQQACERHDRENRQHEQHRVRLGLHALAGEHYRDEREQPKQRIVTDFAQQSVHDGVTAPAV
jgi:hypothetical protein